MRLWNRRRSVQAAFGDRRQQCGVGKSLRLRGRQLIIFPSSGNNDTKIQPESHLDFPPFTDHFLRTEHSKTLSRFNKKPFFKMGFFLQKAESSSFISSFSSSLARKWELWSSKIKKKQSTLYLLLENQKGKGVVKDENGAWVVERRE